MAFEPIFWYTLYNGGGGVAIILARLVFEDHPSPPYNRFSYSYLFSPELRVIYIIVSPDFIPPYQKPVGNFGLRQSD